MLTRRKTPVKDELKDELSSRAPAGALVPREYSLRADHDDPGTPSRGLRAVECAVAPIEIELECR